MAKTSEMPSEEKANLLLETVEDRKADSPLLLDLRGKTILADYFLICTGTSNVHIRAIADRVLEVAKTRRLGNPQIAGEQVGEWVLMDFGDVILHIMNAEARDRFKLEQFWSTPQPLGALPPTGGTILDETGQEIVTREGEEEDGEEEDGEEEDWDEEDAAFFDEADQEVEPIDEEEIDEEEIDAEAEDTWDETDDTDEEAGPDDANGTASLSRNGK